MRSSISYGARSTAEDVLAGVDLSGKTILVTGCNSGIGFETIRALGAHGAHVVGLARSLEAARNAGAKAGGSATPIACDLADLLWTVEARHSHIRKGIVAAIGCAIYRREFTAPRRHTWNLNANLSFPLRLVLQVAQLFMKSVQQGAATQTLLSASPVVQGITGEYWIDCHPARGSIFLKDRDMATRLWTVSEEVIAKHLKLVA